jgi:membrane protease YdiL (CAAX protease family)
MMQGRIGFSFCPNWQQGVNDAVALGCARRALPTDHRSTLCNRGTLRHKRRCYGVLPVKRGAARRLLWCSSSSESAYEDSAQSLRKGAEVARTSPAHAASGSVTPAKPSAASNSIWQPDYSTERPDWAPAWLPAFVYRMPALVQVVVVLAFYAFHLLVLSRHSWAPPGAFQPLLRKIVLAAPHTASFADPLDKPNAKAAAEALEAIASGKEPVTVGYDSIAGLVLILVILWFRWMARKRNPQRYTVLPPLIRPMPSRGLPWELPKTARSKIGMTTLMLLGAYLLSGYGAVVCEQVLLFLSVIGLPLTVPTLRALKVLLGHLMWVFMGVKILGNNLKPFFPPRGKWMRARVHSNWCWWAIGVYYVSSLLFNIADFVNQFIVPQNILNEESVVSKLIHPENQDGIAMAIGSIGPCITAPVFEEVLYRGYLLPAIASFMPVWLAIPVSSVLFAAHHLNLGGMLPLSVLGWAWAYTYVMSGNLFVCAFTHGLWNSRVFLSSLLGFD